MYQETFISGSTVETALSESDFITSPSSLSQQTVYKAVEFGKNCVVSWNVDRCGGAQGINNHNKTSTV